MFVVPILLAFFVVRGLEKRGRARQEDQTESDVQNSVP